MKFKILLQVRSDSKRLPFKCFLLIKNIPAIIYLYKRIAPLKKNLIVLTSNDSSDSYLRFILKQYKINFFNGSLHNVKKRFLDSNTDSQSFSSDSRDFIAISLRFSPDFLAFLLQIFPIFFQLIFHCTVLHYY